MNDWTERKLAEETYRQLVLLRADVRGVGGDRLAACRGDVLALAADLDALDDEVASVVAVAKLEAGGQKVTDEAVAAELDRVRTRVASGDSVRKAWEASAESETPSGGVVPSEKEGGEHA